MTDDSERVSEAPARSRLLDHLPPVTTADGDQILDRFLDWVATQGLLPYPAQEEALLELMTGRHVILSTPTGSGKSLVAQGLHFKAMCEGRRSFYTAPVKALVSEKFFDLCEQFGAENVGMLTGDTSLNWGAPIICCTAEVLSNMAVAQGERTDAPYVVMDEFHYYGDRDRGVAWQIPLIRLPQTRFLLMSATLGNTSEIELHMETVTGQNVARVHSDERPVPLDFQYSETTIHETVESLLGSGKAPIYIVHFTQRAAGEQAQALTSARVTNKSQKQEITRFIGDFRFDTPYGPEIRRILKHGIGIHHAGLLPKYRLLVENLAAQGLLRVICGTDTLGVGVNIPIRTVLFTQLCKFDGQKVALLSVRDFKQISGRAGRKGFDEAGSVVAQAPEYVIENKRIEARLRGSGSRKKIAKKKPPQHGFVPWNRATFEKLVRDPPERLESRFRVDHGLIISCLKNEGSESGNQQGYRGLAQLIGNSHEPKQRLRRHRRNAARLFRSLSRADLVEIVRRQAGGSEVRVSSDLQRDFSLHRTLSLYLVDAVRALDLEAEDYALDVVSITEAILENPRPILIQQQRKARGELIAQLKAERVPYEERMEKVERITWPKPAEDYIYATFDLFSEQHPWVGSDVVHPKGIARDIYESSSSFHDWVKRLELARVEGLVLRYLGQVHDTLARTIPDILKTEELHDMIGFFRALIARVDSSLLEAWEDLVQPAEPNSSAPETPPRDYDLVEDPRGLRARIRGELQQIVACLSSHRYADVAEYLNPACREQWPPERIAETLAPFYEQYGSLIHDPRARQAHLSIIDPLESRRWRVRQVLVDDAGDNFWALEGEVDLRHNGNPPEPLIRLGSIGE